MYLTLECQHFYIEIQFLARKCYTTGCNSIRNGKSGLATHSGLLLVGLLLKNIIILGSWLHKKYNFGRVFLWKKSPIFHDWFLLTIVHIRILARVSLFYYMSTLFEIFSKGKSKCFKILWRFPGNPFRYPSKYTLMLKKKKKKIFIFIIFN